MQKYIFYFLVFILLPAITFAADFESSVKELLQDKLGSKVSVEFKFESQKKVDKIESDESNIKSYSLSFFSSETRSFKVLALYNDDSTVEVFGKYEAFFEVPVAAKFVKFGQELTGADIKTLKLKKMKVSEEPVADISKIIGLEAKYNIQAGQILKESDFKRPTVIKENDPVTIMYSSQDISLKTLGIALAPGAIGEKIRVKNEKTGIIVFGEIIDKT